MVVAPFTYLLVVMPDDINYTYFAQGQHCPKIMTPPQLTTASVGIQ